MPPEGPAWLRQDPQHWRAGTLDRKALWAQVHTLAASAGFVPQAQRFARCWLQTQAEHPELRAVFRNTQRYLLLVASLVLHQRRDAAEPGSGITPGKLLAFFEHSALPALRCSPGQVKAMMAHARLQGLLKDDTAEATDGRVRPLVPTPLLQRTMASWVRGFVAAMDGVLPLPARAPQVLTTPAVVARMFGYRLAALTEDRFVLLEGLDGLRWVMAHDHGYRVMLHLVLAAQPGAAGEPVPVPLSVSEIARTADVSRGHVRNLLDDAAAEGWWAGERSASDGLLITPERWATALEWIARELVWMHGLLRAAQTTSRTRRPSGAPALP
jgi:hypothetical protein